MNLVRDAKGRFAINYRPVECYLEGCNVKVPKKSKCVAHCSDYHCELWKKTSDYPPIQNPQSTQDFIARRIAKLKNGGKEPEVVILEELPLLTNT